MTAQIQRKRLVFGVLALAVLAAAAAFSIVEAVSSKNSISNQGSVRAANLGLYWDQACTNAMTTIDWGTLSAGAVHNVSIYVRNEGGSAVRLNLTTSNCHPANVYMYVVLTWNLERQVVEPRSVVLATITMSVSPCISGIDDFSLDTVVTGVAE